MWWLWNRFTREEEETMRELSQRPDIYDLIAKSIAPSIYGCDDIKRSGKSFINRQLWTDPDVYNLFIPFSQLNRF